MYNIYTENIKSRIDNYAEDMAIFVNQKGTNDFLFNPKSQFRVNIINSDGHLNFDNTIQNIENIESHKDRPEFKKAMIKGYAKVFRYSKTSDKMIYYSAIKLDNGDILRISAHVDSIFNIISKMSFLFVILFVVLCVISLIIAKKVSKSIIKPLNEIDINNPLLLNIYDEIKPFVTKISKQQEQIDGQLKELQKRNNEFQFITKFMSEGLILLNKDGIIISMNKMAQKVFNVNHDCVGLSFLAIDKSQMIRDFFVKNKNNNKKHIEINKFNQVYQLHFNLIELDMQIKGYAILIIDITEKSKAQQQRQEFTANVSHELKTPLQSIIGYSELIEHGIVKESDIKNFASKITIQSKRLITLIEDIIFLSRLDEGQIIVCEDVSLMKICHEIFEILSEKAKSRNISLNIIGSDIKFKAVYRYIYEFIYNLCDNAVKYNKEGGFVNVSLKENDKKIIISVSDNGIGIPEKDQDRIFERFYRVDKSHSRQTGGTGLGLSIVKRVVLFHKGKIKLESSSDGTTFTVILNKSKLEALARKSKTQDAYKLQEYDEND